MGNVIRKTASPHDIFTDTRATLANARARGGLWKSYAETRLAAVGDSIESIETRVGEAEKAMVTLQATVDSAKEAADDVLGRVSDEIWNTVGRPRSDSTLAMLFPGGIPYYVKGPVQEQPARMELLARLLESGLHPRIPTDQAAAHAVAITASTATLRAALDAASGPRTQLQLLDRVRRTVATSAQLELQNLKRIYKAERFSEADIHATIPDRPEPSKRTTTAATASAGEGGVTTSVAAQTNGHPVAAETHVGP
jgi:hypothetical protein